MDTKISFLAFCNLCEHLNRLKKIEQKRQRLGGFIEEWIKEDSLTFYSFIRLLLPHLDSERENYGLKEIKMAEMYISALALPRDSQDAHCLRNWQQSKHKDFSDSLYEVLKRRLGEDQLVKRNKIDGNLNSLKDVNLILDQLTISGTDRSDLFLKLTAKMSATEQKWLTRIILKCLRVGIPDGQVLKLIHPDAPAIFDVRMNLNQVISIFTTTSQQSSPYDRDEQLKIKLFSPFKPMLADREELEKSVEILAGPFFIEPKLDGERCQVHFCKSSGIFRYFSRQGTEYTYLYGRDGSEGSLSPKIVSEFPFDDMTETIVLDGEMVVYDPLIDKFLPFGTLKTSAASKYDTGRAGGGEPHPCLVIFDIVYWNGQSLLNWSLNERASLLKRVLVKPIKGYFDLIERSELQHSTSDISTALEIAIQDQVEGLILKDPQSLYIPAHRSSHWIKIKPEYVAGLCDDLDLVVIGAWYGRAGNIKEAYGKANEFLCGIWTESAEQDGYKTVVPFVKIGSGYNSHEWSVINQNLEHLLVPIKSSSNISIVSELKGADRPDLLVSNPFKSIVIQVKGSQIVASTTYKTLGLSLRFPRFIKLRLDRAGDSSMTEAELRKLKDITAGTLAKSGATGGGVAGEPVKKQVNRAKGKMAMAIERSIASNESTNCDSTSNFLDGYKFLVLNGNDQLDKQQIEQKITSFGGKCVQSVSQSEKFMAVAGGDCGIRVKNLKVTGTVDLVKVDWLLESEKVGTFAPLKTRHYFHLTDRTRNLLKAQKLPEISTNQELKDLLNEISIESSDPQAVSDICTEFLENGIELPKWSRGFGQVIPISSTFSSFEKLKIEFIRAQWIIQ